MGFTINMKGRYCVYPGRIVVVIDSVIIFIVYLVPVPVTGGRVGLSEKRYYYS